MLASFDIVYTLQTELHSVLSIHRWPNNRKFPEAIQKHHSRNTSSTVTKRKKKKINEKKKTIPHICSCRDSTAYLKIRRRCSKYVRPEDLETRYIQASMLYLQPEQHLCLSLYMYIFISDAPLCNRKSGALPARSQPLLDSGVLSRAKNRIHGVC